VLDASNRHSISRFAKPLRHLKKGYAQTQNASVGTAIPLPEAAFRGFGARNCQWPECRLRQGNDIICNLPSEPDPVKSETRVALAMSLADF